MKDPDDFLPLTPQQFHILLSLVEGTRHGYGILLDVKERTRGELRMGTGTLYTALARLVDLRLVLDAGRADARRRYYQLTPLGRAVLRAETARLEALVSHAHASGVRPPARRAPSPARS
jgi:DNA-binding PadR family transcriptional regulator